MDRPSAPLGMPFAEFVAMMAFLMALTALSVDIMLVVLPDISNEFALVEANERQYMVTVYLAAFASGHIFAGPLSDRLGRRPILLAGLTIYAMGAALALVADSYALLLAARAVQGFGAAGPRVVAVAVVRDRFVGRAMSQVMSFVMTVFIILPVLAPAIGSLIAQGDTWRPIFVFLCAFGIGTFVWVFVRLPETNPVGTPEARPVVGVGQALGAIASNGTTVGYMLSLGCVFGCLMGYIATSQQLFADVYGVVDWFPAVFASVASAMIVSTFINSRFVYRLGMRRLCHGATLALALLSAVAVATILVVGTVPLLVLIAYLAMAFFLIGLVLPNFNAIAMEPLGPIAGTGSSFIGFVMIGVGATLGGLVGQLYDHTVLPLLVGFLAYSSTALAIVAITERGRIMQPATTAATP